jgi:hypothetical protein
MFRNYKSLVFLTGGLLLVAHAHATDFVLSGEAGCQAFAQGGDYFWDMPDYCVVNNGNLSLNDTLEVRERLYGQELVNSGSIFNYATIIYGEIYNFGLLINENDAPLYGSYISVDEGALVENHGTLENNGYINLCETAAINNKTDATLENSVSGEIQCCQSNSNSCGNIVNSAGALFINKGLIDADITIVNSCGGIIEDTNSPIAYIQDTTNCDLAVNNLGDIVKEATSSGLEASLAAMLKNINNLLSKGNTNAAINMLNAFIAEVEAQTGKNQLTLEESENLTTLAQAIIDSLSP